MRKVKLKDIAEKVDYGLTEKANNKKVGPKFLRITDIQNGLVNWDSVPHCKCSEKDFKKNKLDSGDIVFVRTGATTGKSFLINEVKEPTVYASYLIRLRLNNEKVLPEFVAYFFKSELYWRQIYADSDGATLPSFNATKLKKIQLPLPTLSEQKAIVAKLDRAQRLIDIDQQMLAKYDELIQSVFLEMFGDPVVNSYDDGDVCELEDLVIFKGGGTPSKMKGEFWGGDIPWVSPKDMKWNFINNSQDKITSTAIEESTTKLIRSGAVLAVVRSGILKNTWPLAINTVSVTLNQDMKALICTDRINSYFLLYYLKNYSRKILGTVRGTTADNISTSVFKKIPVKLPILDKQMEFEQIVKSIEKEKSATKVRKSEELFSSLMQKAFGYGNRLVSP